MRHAFFAAVVALAAGAVVTGQDTRVKPPIRGLVSMGAYRFVGRGGPPVNTLDPLNAKPGIFGGLVVVASWAQLEPTRGSEIDPDNVIGKALEDVRAYNAKNPQKPLAVRLRVWGGFMAPGWAMQIGGDPIQAVHNGTPRSVGRFWTPAYRSAWASMQERLAAKYDSRPLIREVAMTSCMSFTAEPFFVPTEEPVQKPLRAAGFTDAAYKQCLTHGIDDFAGWKASRIVLSVNPLRTGPNQGNGDAAFTMNLMKACRATLRVRCVLDNHDLETEVTPALKPIYALMKQLGPELVFQTYKETPQDFEGTIRFGVQQGATAIELWQDYHGFPEVPDAQLRKWAQIVEDNAPKR
jgi:hypothetical protein